LNADYRRLLAVGYQNDGDYRAHSGDTRSALESFRKKIALDEQSLAADPANPQLRGDLAYSVERIGDLLAELGDDSQALSYYQRFVKAAETLAADDSQSLSARYKLILARGDVGKTQAKLGDQQSALEQCRKIITLLNQTVDDPADAYTRGLRARAYIYLGEVYSRLAAAIKTAPDQAKKHIRVARNMYQQSFDIWNDLRNRGTLAADDAAKPEEVSAEIAKCDAVLRR
jgi:tetratricopeptide (TPR) repeat protein